MSDSTFRFKQFTVHQDKCAMKVGTDAVLLGSWIHPRLSRFILDIGTGTGLLALMLAQKSFAGIDAIDIDEGAFFQATENIRTSPWFDRIYVYHQSFQDFINGADKQYDLIVTNPPYFHHASKPSIESRLNARHDDQLTFLELVNGVKKTLSPEGKFYLILPFKEGMEFMDIAQAKGLFCHQLVRVKTKADKQKKRLMMEYSKEFAIPVEDEIIIHNEDCSFTEDYLNLTKDYYIGLKNLPAGRQGPNVLNAL
jgi:tRNA1Val (adenine37-N6)-methyltransferase